MPNPRKTLDRINVQYPDVASRWRLETLTESEAKTVRAKLNQAAKVNFNSGRVWGVHNAETSRGCRCAPCVIRRYVTEGKGTPESVAEACELAPELAEQYGIGEGE